jgi:hypothetical protein
MTEARRFGIAFLLIGGGTLIVMVVTWLAHHV